MEQLIFSKNGANFGMKPTRKKLYKVIMRSNFILRLFAVLGILITVMGFWPNGQVTVQANIADLPAHLPTQIIADQNCWGLDIIFLVSQSTMSNINDTFKLRMEGVRSAIDMLGENSLFFCTGYTHRISVIGFAQIPGKTTSGGVLDTTIETYIPISGKSGSDLIHPNLNNLAAWEDLKNNELKPALTVKDLGFYSNYQGAFEAAAAQFKVWGNKPVDNLPRHRAVIVIGEGGLCTADLLCNSYNKVIDGLNKILDPGGNIFPFKGFDNPQSVAIYFLGIIARKSAANQFFDDPIINSFWTNITTNHGGTLEILQRGQGLNLENNLNTDLALKLSKVMNNLLGSRLTANNCQPFWINPYVSDFSILHFFRKNAAGQNGLDKVTVTINGTKGKTLIAQYANGQTKIGSGQIIDYSNPANEKYVLYKTPPGLYSMAVQGADFCQDIDLEMGQIGMAANVLSPIANARFPEVDVAPYYAQANPSPFRVQLFQPDVQGVMRPLKELANYPLDIKVTYKSQAGAQNPVSITLPLYRVDDANAIYETKDPIQTRYANVYSWVLTAATSNPRQFDPNNPDLAPIEIFKKEGVFSVGSVNKPFDFVVQNLGKTQEYPLINGALTKPLSVTVQIVNPDNSPFRIDQSIAPKGVSPFEAILKRPNGDVLAKDFTQTDKNNVYSVQLFESSNKPNAYEPGCYTVVVRIKDNFDKTVYVPRRIETDPITICLRPSEKFTWKIISPSGGIDYPLHPRFDGFAAPVSLPILIQAIDSSNQQINASYLQTTDKPVFTGVISMPGETKGIQIVFSADKKTGDFTADWPAEADQEGQYTLRVMLNTDQLNIAYTSAINRLDPLQFTRSDDLLSKPWAVPAIALCFTLLVLVLILILNSFVKPIRTGRIQKSQGQN